MILPKLELIIFIKLQFQGVFLQFYWMSNISATTMQHDPVSTQIWLIPEDLKHGTLPHSRSTSAPKTACNSSIYSHLSLDDCNKSMRTLDCNKEAQTSPHY